MSTPAANKSTQQQRRRGQQPPADYIVTSAKGHQILVRRPDGRRLRVRPSGRLLATGGVKSGQSYLHVPAA
jgi:hypothetical protein